QEHRRPHAWISGGHQPGHPTTAHLGISMTVDRPIRSAPHLRAHISRFGAYATDDLHRSLDPFDPL
ncbi:hypothetical protein AB0M44_48285, partial [Streptosporangium subroseum]|uniref:hypothetical protein n=1 Tax=Streptosporangium subroseum TaxID=106412 RepID=UPI003433B878